MNNILFFLMHLYCFSFLDGPRFKIRPRSAQTDLGATVTLTCDVDGNPPPDIVWIHEDTDRVWN